MGGDGGTKAVNRTYLRGAGAATTSGDIARRKHGLDPAVAAQEALRRLTHCALTDQPLFANTAAGAAANNSNNNNIVACPYGRLYHREAVVEAMIRRKQQESSSSAATTTNDNQHKEDDDSSNLIIRHIRGLKDLRAVQFQLNDAQIPICPVTSRELTGKGCTAYALLRDGDNGDKEDDTTAAPVVSGYALQQVGEAALLQEYNATAKLRLAPPADALPQIRQQWEEQCAAERAAKKSKKKKKDKNKRKHKHNNGENKDDTGAGAKKAKKERSDT